MLLEDAVAHRIGVREVGSWCCSRSATVQRVHHGPGVVVGPAYILVGAALLAFRAGLSAWLSRRWPDSAFPHWATSSELAIIGASSILGGTLGLLAGLGLLS